MFPGAEEVVAGNSESICRSRLDQMLHGADNLQKSIDSATEISSI